jgi:multiple antibiotic resistance protein
MIFSFSDITTISLTLFAIIDVVGALPLIITIKNKQKHLDSGKATLAAGALMVLFLIVGDKLLNIIGVDLPSFAVAGSIVIFILGLEMILGIDIFRQDPNDSNGSIITIAFPIIAGSGTLTTIISMKAFYEFQNILIAILLNLILVYAVLKSTTFLERILGKAGLGLIRKFFGVILISIAVKIFKSNFL